MHSKILASGRRPQIIPFGPGGSNPRDLYTNIRVGDSGALHLGNVITFASGDGLDAEEMYRLREACLKWIYNTLYHSLLFPENFLEGVTVSFHGQAPHVTFHLDPETQNLEIHCPFDFDFDADGSHVLHFIDDVVIPRLMWCYQYRHDYLMDMTTAPLTYRLGLLDSISGMSCLTHMAVCVEGFYVRQGGADGPNPAVAVLKTAVDRGLVGLINARDHVRHALRWLRPGTMNSIARGGALFLGEKEIIPSLQARQDEPLALDHMYWDLFVVSTITKIAAALNLSVEDILG